LERNLFSIHANYSKKYGRSQYNDNETLGNTKGAIKNGQSRETGNIKKKNIREYRRGNQQWTIQRKWQH
jgi:hypothetical protein